MKAVLISIKPKWCEKILSGEKTIDVRKTRPKETPFKCYIYCTKDVRGLQGFTLLGRYRLGKIIGEFVCRYAPHSNEYLFDEKKISLKNLLKRSCMTFEELNMYRCDKNIYAWYISDLKIYDKPKEPGEFYRSLSEKDLEGGRVHITRPPQSWCYVEGME